MQDRAMPPLTRPAYGTKPSAAGRRLDPVDAEAALSRITELAQGTEYVPQATERPATRGQRLAARLVDLVCCGVLLAVTQATLWTILVNQDPRLSGIVLGGSELTQYQGVALDQVVESYAWLVALVTAATWFLYEVPLTVLRSQTLGKMAVGIRVVTEDPRTILTWRGALARWAYLGVPSVFGVFGLPAQLIDCLWLLRRRQYPQCLHDRLARTRVIAVNRAPA